MLVLVCSPQLISQSGSNSYPFGGVVDAILPISGVVCFLACFCHCFCFSLSLPTGLLSLNSLFPSIYDINGCATTAVSLVPGWVITFLTTGRIFLDKLM